MLRIAKTAVEGRCDSTYVPDMHLPFRIGSATTPPGTSCSALAVPMFRRSPRDPEYPKDLFLASAFQELAFSELLPLLPTQNVLIQPMLIQSHAFPASQKPDAPIEDVVPSKIDQRRTHLVPRYKQEIDPPPWSVLDG